MARGRVYNNITSEEKTKLINPKNMRLLEDWKEYLSSSDKSQETIDQYQSQTIIFFTWLLDNADNKFFVDVTKRDIIKYQNYLLNTLKVSSSRVRSLKAAISSLSNYIVRILDDTYTGFKNIVNFIPAPNKELVREKTVLEPEEVERVLSELTNAKKYQLACVLALAAYSGNRKSELLRFKVSFFKDEYIISGMYRTPEKIKTKGRGKAGKMLNRLVLASAFKPFLVAWLEERERLGVSNTIDDLFVIYRNGEWIPMQISSLNNWTEQLTKLFGNDFYFHAMRHYFCTALQKAKIPPEIIKQIIGWENLEMVSLYTDIEAIDELDKYFNDDGIKPQEK